MNTGISRRIDLITFAACALLQAFTPARAGAQELRLSTRSAEAQSAFRAGLDVVGNELYAQAALHLERALLLYTASPEGVTERVRGYENLIRRFPDFAPPLRRLGYLNAREQVDLSQLCSSWSAT